MDRVKAKRRLRPEAWPQMVSRFVSSRMSAEAFSRQQRISLASLKHWQQKLDEAKPIEATVLRPSQPAMSGFVDLGALRSGASRIELRLDLGDGVLLTLSRS